MIVEVKKYLLYLIVLDVMMLEMDGIEVCEKMRVILEFFEIIIIFLIVCGEDYF